MKEIVYLYGRKYLLLSRRYFIDITNGKCSITTDYTRRKYSVS